MRASHTYLLELGLQYKLYSTLFKFDIVVQVLDLEGYKIPQEVKSGHYSMLYSKRR